MRPHVYITCTACDWRYDVPEEDTAFSGGIPWAKKHPKHECVPGVDLEEHAVHEVDVYTKEPAHNFKLTLE